MIPKAADTVVIKCNLSRSGKMKNGRNNDLKISRPRAPYQIIITTVYFIGHVAVARE